MNEVGAEIDELVTRIDLNALASPFAIEARKRLGEWTTGDFLFMTLRLFKARMALCVGRGTRFIGVADEDFVATAGFAAK